MKTSKVSNLQISKSQMPLACCQLCVVFCMFAEQISVLISQIMELAVVSLSANWKSFPQKRLNRACLGALDPCGEHLQPILK